MNKFSQKYLASCNAPLWSYRLNTNIWIYLRLYAGRHQTFEASKVCKPEAKRSSFMPIKILSDE